MGKSPLGFGGEFLSQSVHVEKSIAPFPSAIIRGHPWLILRYLND
jgi:hypothetical protein